MDETTEDSETTGEATTDGKVDVTTEGSETTEVVPANRNTMTGHARSARTQTLHDEQCVTDAKNHVRLEVEVANVETTATITTEEATTDDRAVETTVDTKTIEVDNANSVAPSTTTIGHAQSATTQISRSETYVTDAKNLALAVEEAVAVDRETRTDDKADRATISALPTVATDDKVDETTEDSETTETATTDDKADGTTEDSAAVVVNGTAVAKATIAQPAEVGNEMDDLSEILQTTTFDEPRGSDRAMPTIDHPVISELHANLNEKTSEWMWPRERRITLP